MNRTCFQFNNKFYKQTFGTPMGSPISLTLADLVMQDLEHRVVNSLDFHVHTYFRYIDETFIIIPEVKINSVLQKFNSYHSRLNFTHEIENQNSNPFLILKLLDVKM